MNDPLFQVWAKLSGTDTPYPLVLHSLDTAAAARALYQHWLRPGLRQRIADWIAGGDTEQAATIVATVAGQHDLGKANPVFQSQMLSTRPRPDAEQRNLNAAVAALADTLPFPSSLPVADTYLIRRHEVVGLIQEFGGELPDDTDDITDHWLAAVGYGHHGTWRRMPGRLGLHGIDCATQKWEKTVAGISDIISDATGLPKLPPAPSERVLPSVILLTGLVILADWLASSRADGDVALAKRDPRGYLEHREPLFRDLIDRQLGVTPTITDPEATVLGSHADTPTAAQRAAADSGDGLWIVTESTGSGKTEAALLRHAQRPEPLMFALPTKATASAMWRRVLPVFDQFGDATAALLMENRDLDAFYAGPSETGPQSTQWLEFPGRGLLASIGVGTIDQVLLGALPRRHIMLRLLALANRHIIIDEAHTLDAYQHRLVIQLLHFWGATGTRVTVLSATLPTSTVQEYVSAYTEGEHTLAPEEVCYPATISASAAGVDVRPLATARAYQLGIELRRVEMDGCDGYWERSEAMTQAAFDAVQAIRRAAPAIGTAIGVVVNTVGRAQELGRRLLAVGIPVVVLHSRMTQDHRGRIERLLEQKIGKRGAREPLVVIGTQVIEASLDIDFDAMVTELAPAPAIVQRNGRLFRGSIPTTEGWEHPADRRHREGKTPILVVLCPSDNTDISVPYLRLEQDLTAAALQQCNGVLRIPEDVQQFVDSAHVDYGMAVASLGEPGGDDAVMAVLRQQQAGDDAVAQLAPADTWATPMLDGDIEWRHLAALTRDSILTDQNDPGQTRLIDRDTATVLLCDPQGNGTAHWRGAAKQALQSSDPTIARAAIGMSINVPSHYVGDGKALVPIADSDQWKAVRGRRRILPVSLNGSAHYDEVLGFVRSTKGNQ